MKRSSPPIDEQPSSDGFSLKFSGGKGLLELSGEKLSDALMLQQLQLAIDKISFPFDVSLGVKGLSNRRLRLQTLSLELAIEPLLLAAEQRLVSNTWMHNLRVAFYEECVCVGLDYGPVETSVPVSFRLVPVSWKNAVAFVVDDVRCYGPLPAPLLSIGLLCAIEVTGFGLEGVFAVPQDLVKTILLHVLPTRGWRLPAYNDLCVTEFVLHPRRCAMTFRSLETAENRSGTLEKRLEMDMLKRLEELRALMDADQFIGKGDLKTARSHLAALLERMPDSPPVSTRLAMIDVMDASLRKTVLRYLSDSMDVWSQKRLDTLSVIVHGAALDNDVETEVWALEQLFARSMPLEKLFAGMRIGYLLGETNRLKAISYLEQAVSVRRDSPAALIELIELYAAQNDVIKVQSLLPRWIAIHKEPNAQVNAHVEAGQVLLKMSQWQESVKHFERATVGDPDNEDAAWGLASALAGAQEVQRAVAGFEKLAMASRAKGDKEGEAEALGAIGEIWVKQGEPELAIPRLRDSISVCQLSEVQHLLAAALVSLGRVEQGVMHYEEALEIAADHDKEWATNAMILARLFYSHLDNCEAANYWIDQAARCEEVQNAAYDLKIQVLQKQENWSDLAVVLEKRMVKAGQNVPLDTVAQLASARVAAGEYVAAISTLESALATYPDDIRLLDVYVYALRVQGNVRKLDEALQQQYMAQPTAAARVEIAEEIGTLQLNDFEDLSLAISWFRRALKDDENALEAQEGLVDALGRIGSTELGGEIEQLLTLYQQSAPKQKVSDALRKLGEFKISQGEKREGAALLRKALPDLKDEVRDDALMTIADVLVEAGDFALAKDMFATVRATQGAKARYIAAQGEAESAIETKDYSAAYAAAVVAGSGPANMRGRAVRLLVQASLFIDKEQEALDILFRVAQNVDEEEAILLLEFGAQIAWKQLDDFVLARSFFEEILALSPDNERGRNRLLALLEASGNRAELARGLVRFAAAGSAGISDIKRAADFFFAEGLFKEAAGALAKTYESARDIEIGRMLATALKRSGNDAEAIELLRSLADDDEYCRGILLEYYETYGDVDAMIALLGGTKAPTKGREFARLSRLADLTIQKGEPLLAASYLLDAAKNAPDSDLHRDMYSQVMQIAITQQHPQLFARAVDGISYLVSAQELAELKLELAVMYYRCRMLPEVSLLLEDVDSLRVARWDMLLKSVEENSDMSSLVHLVVQYAHDQGRWSDLEYLLSLQIDRTQGEQKYVLVKQRAGLRELRLGDDQGAGDDWMVLFDFSHLDIDELIHLEGLLEKLGRGEERLHVLSKRISLHKEDVDALQKAAALAQSLGKRVLHKQFLRMLYQLHPTFSNAYALYSILEYPRHEDEIRLLLPTIIPGIEKLEAIKQKEIYEIQLDVLGTDDLDTWASTMLKLVALFPAEVHYLEQLCAVLEQKEDWSLWVDCMNKKLEAEESDAEKAKLLIALAMVYRKYLSQEESAIECFKEAFCLEPTNATAAVALGQFAYKNQQWELLSQILKALDAEEWHPEITLWRAAQAEHENQTDKAFEFYSELIDKAPQVEGAFAGFLHHVPEEGFEQEIRDILAVTNNKGGFAQMPASMHRKAAKAYFVVDDTDKAQRHLELSLSLEPLDKSSLLLLEKIYQRTGAASARAYTLEKIAALEKGDQQIDYLVASAQIFLDELKQAAKAETLLLRAAEISRKEPDVLLGMADVAWALQNWMGVTSNLERLRLVAPHLNIDASRMYRFAFSLSKTGEWPITDVLELLERIIPNLIGKEYDDARNLYEMLSKEKNPRYKQ